MIEVVDKAEIERRVWTCTAMDILPDFASPPRLHLLRTSRLHPLRHSSISQASHYVSESTGDLGEGPDDAPAPRQPWLPIRGWPRRIWHSWTCSARSRRLGCLELTLQRYETLKTSSERDYTKYITVDGGHRAIKYSRLGGVKKEIYSEGTKSPGLSDKLALTSSLR